MAKFEHLLAVRADDSQVKRLTITLAQAERRFKQLGLSTKKLTATSKLSRRVTESQGQTITSVSQKFKNGNQQIVNISKSTGKASGMMADFSKAMKRVLIVVPVWMIMRTALMGVIQGIQGMVKNLLELEKEMGRVAGVTRGNKKDLNDLRDAVIDYSRTASRGFKEVASAMYALGSAGLDVTQQMVGFEHIMNLSIGTFGNTEQIAKLVAGAFNVFGKSMRGAHTDAQRFKQIADLLAYTYSTQQVELSEIANAMTYVASIGSLMNISFETLVGTIGVLNTGMLKGSKSGCYDNQTEVLTKKGFKFWKDATINDEYATLNPNTHELEYQKPSRMVKEKWDGFMIKFKNKYLDLLVTPDHHMYTRSEKGNYEDNFAKDLLNKNRYYYRGCNWNGKDVEYFYLPKIEKFKNQFSSEIISEKRIPIEKWIKFLGYYLSEGWINSNPIRGIRKHKVYTVNISQFSNSKCFEDIKETLDNLGYHYRYENSHNNFVISNKQLYTYLKQFGKSNEKFIPKDVKKLPPKILKIFLEAYINGDGQRQENRAYIGTNSIRMRDDLMEIALKAGYGTSYCLNVKKGTKMGIGESRANYDVWKISINNVTEFSFNYKHRKQVADKNNYKNKCEQKLVYYNEYVYCAEVPNHILFVRRNGKTVWCKNTALMNAFIRLAQKSESLATLGVIFDPSQPLDFVNVMTQLHGIYGKQAVSLAKMKDIFQVFGRRGGRAVAQLIKDFERWKGSLDDTQASFADFAEEMREKAEDTLPMAFAKLANSIKANFADAFKGAGDSLREFINDLTKSMEEIREKEKYGMFMEKPPLEIPAVGLIPGLTPAIRKLGGGMSEVDKLRLETGKKIFDMYLKQIELSGELKDDKYKIRNVDEQLNKIAKKRVEGIINESQMYNTIRIMVYELLGAKKALTAEGHKIVKLLMEEVEILAEEERFAGELTNTQKERLQNIKETAKYQLLQAQGVKTTAVEYVKLVDLVDKINERIKKSGNEELNRVRIQDLMAGNYEDLEEAIIHVAGAQKEAEKALKSSLNLITKMEKEAKEYGDEITSHELDLLKIRGATNAQLIQAELLMNEELNLGMSQAGILGKQLELEREITKEKLGQNKLSSQAMKLYEIAQKYGVDVAKTLGKVLTGALSIEELSEGMGFGEEKALGVFQKEFGGMWKQFQAKEFFGMGGLGGAFAGGRDIPIPEREAVRGFKERMPQIERAQEIIQPTIPISIASQINVQIDSKRIADRVIDAVIGELKDKKSSLSKEINDKIEEF